MSTPCFRPRRRFVSSETTRGWSAPGSATTRLRSWSRCTSSASCSAPRRSPRAPSCSPSARRASATFAGSPPPAPSFEPEAVVAVEGHGLEHVIVDAVGSLRASVRVTGPGGHSWVDRGRPSAIHALLELGASLARESSADVPVNVGLVSGGRSVNTIAGEAELAVEARALDEAVLERFAGVLAAPRGRALRFGSGRRDHRQTAGGTARPGFASSRGRSAPCASELGLPDDARRGLDRRERCPRCGHPGADLGVANGEGMHTPERAHRRGVSRSGCRSARARPRAPPRSLAGARSRLTGAARQRYAGALVSDISSV